MKLDTTDRLLRELQHDAARTHDALGAAVHLSPSSVRRRIAALQAGGVLRAQVALVDPALATPGVTVLTLVSFARESTRVYDDFQQRMRNDPQVSQCYSVAGEYDFVLLVHAADPAAYERWGQHTLLADGNIKRYDSFVVWSTVKHDPQPLVPLTDV
jgi:Lrp/AsnC family transcriptional regulator, leucine-responsive regulatory protein